MYDTPMIIILVPLSSQGLSEARVPGRDYVYLIKTQIWRETIPLTLEDVLVFATGASKIPPFRFDDKPTIEFLH